MKWKKKLTEYCMVVSCFGRSLVVFSWLLLLQLLPLSAIYILYESYITRLVLCIYLRQTHLFDGTYTLYRRRRLYAPYTRVRTAYTAVGGAAASAASAAQIESPIHMQLTSCSAFFSFFFISVHFARAAFIFGSTAAPSRIIQKLDGVGRTIKSTIALHWVGIAKRIG